MSRADDNFADLAAAFESELRIDADSEKDRVAVEAES